MLAEKVPRASNCTSCVSRADTPFEIGFVPASPEATPRQVGFELGLFWHNIGFNWL